MRKREMSESQLKIRQQIVDRLTTANWTQGDEMSGFDDGELVMEEAVFQRSGTMDLTFSYEASKDQIVFIMEKGLGGPGVTLVLKCLDKLTEVLDFVVSIQESVTESNFRDHLVALADICDEVYLDQGTKELVRLDNAAPRTNE